MNDNPYLNSKLLWNDLYGSVEEKLKKSYRLIILLASVIVIITVGLIAVALQDKVQPYVALIHGNELIRVDKFESPSVASFKPKLAVLLAKQFIQVLRTQSSDDNINRDNFITALTMSSDATTNLVKDMHQKPGSKNNLRQVKLSSVILRSNHTLDLRWQEITIDGKTGEKLITQHYSAELNYQFGKTSNDSLIAEHNPLGFTITNFAWSQDVQN